MEALSSSLAQQEHACYTALNAKQAELFPAQAKTVGNGTTLRDPAFLDNKSLPIHRWVPWIAGYSASFVDDVISTYLPDCAGRTVLDPFSGVGTTLVQAALRGCRTVGFEINPYPALAVRAKLSALGVDLKTFDEAVAAMKRDAADWRSPAPAGVSPPPLRSKLPFFSPRVESQVLHALAFINRIAAPAIADIFRAAFGAVMVGVSNYSYEPSLTSRPASGKRLVEDADLAAILSGKLEQMREDIAWAQQQPGAAAPFPGRVINADFFAAHGEVGTAAVDLMVTSPPYMNNYHYVRNTRPHLYWLDFISSPQQQKPLETGNFGQYWQTVRDAAPLPLSFAHAELENVLAQLRKIRSDKGAYGGPGWANYVAAYFNDCSRFMAVLKRVLAPGGVGVIVIGNSIIQGLDIRTERILGEIGAMQGLVLEEVRCIRRKRVGASITQSTVRQGERSRAILAEFAVIVRQP